MVVNLAFQAGHLAERRGCTSVDLVDPDALTSVLPGSGEVIVLAPAETLSLQHARDVAALSASRKSVAVVSPVVLTEVVRAWSGQVRWAAARNPATPLSVLEAMANVGE